MSLGPMRFGHNEGYSLICFSSDGETIVTAGSDGDVKMFQDSSGPEVKSFLVGDEVLALAVGPDLAFFVASIGTNTVQKYDGRGDGRTHDCVLTRFTADVTCIQSTPCGKFLVAGSEDMTIRVVHVDTFKDTLLKGHSAPILSVAVNPKADRVVSASCDGSVRLWNVHSCSVVKNWPKCWPASNDVTAAPSRGGVAWRPNADAFSLPLRDCVQLMAGDESEWSVQAEFRPDESNALQPGEMFTLTSWSTNGCFLAAATSKGRIFCWSIASATPAPPLFVITSPRRYAFSSIAWNPKKAQIAVIDVSGYWGLVTQLDFDPITAAASAETVSDHTDQFLNEDELAEALFDNDEDDDNENSFSIRKIKREAGFGLGEPEEKRSASPSGSTVISTEEESQMGRPGYILEPDIQPPFQPGSTPVHFSSRFMTWNSVGVVKCMVDSDDRSSIDVEFHDSSLHHAIFISNVNHFTMAALSKEALVLARDSPSDSEPSKLLCHYFASSDLNKEWSVDLENKEDVVAVACGRGWLAVATDTRNLRLFTLGGMQLEILSLPGPVVALAGQGPFLMAAVHLGSPLPGDQFIGVAVFAVGPAAKHLPHPQPHFQVLSLTPKSFLTWLGFTDENTPCVMDSAGMIRIRNKNYGGGWMTVCNTNEHCKGPKDHHFLVGVSETEFVARTIYVKGGRYPHTVPWPTVTVVPLSLPLLGQPSSEKTSSEHSFWKADLTLRCLELAPTDPSRPERDQLERVQSEALLKLFAIACRSDQDSRAMEIAALMDQTTLQLAIRYAGRMRKIQLANKVSEAACKMQEESQEASRLSPSQESVDLFASQDELDDDIIGANQVGKGLNPIKEAIRKGNQQQCQTLKGALATTELRNPFRKSANPSPSSSTSGLPSTSGKRPGIVFDDMSKPESAFKGSRSSFGSFIRSPDVGKKGATPHQVSGKENCQKESAQPLFGFQLWLAENEQALANQLSSQDADSIREAGLTRWRSLSKEAKEEYKVPRVPSSKRKQQPEGDGSHGTVASKLARFSVD